MAPPCPSWCVYHDGDMSVCFGPTTECGPGLGLARTSQDGVTLSIFGPAELTLPEAQAFAASLLAQIAIGAAA